MKKVILLVTILQYCYTADPDIETEEIRARDYLQLLNKKEAELSNKIAISEWAYASNITDANLKAKIALSLEIAAEQKKDWEETKKFNWQTFSDYEIKRQFKKYLDIGSAALPEEKHKRLEKIISEMQSIYSTAKVCKDEEKTDCNNSLEPELTHYFTTSRDPELLKRLWVNWRNAIGPKVKHLYKEYVDLSNESARLNSYANNVDYWLRTYEDQDFRKQVQSLWEQLKPLYLQIHAYVRHQLRKKYGDIVSEKGPIPAHLLGNMWAQTWSNIEDFTIPFPGKQSPDLTEELIKQNYTAKRIFETSEKFFKSINLTAMPESFWEKSILEKPDDRELVCHASAWDFYDGKDFRIKQCTEINIEHFYTAHHEMGHVEYFIQYKDQPIKFREGANAGFHEAVGDVISLSVRSTNHLRKIGLLKTPDDSDLLLNNLYGTGLDKIVFLPFAYLMDLWRWDVFEGKIKPDNYNCKWWDLREKYQGVEPPVDRTENDFDPSGKYHIVADVPYIRYFVSFVIQFQFHRALCEKAGQYDPINPVKPLHECDIYENVNAGNALKKMLAMGSSRPWPEAMEVLTGQRTMDATGLLEYFKPLQTWLEQENTKNEAHIGWEKSTKDPAEKVMGFDLPRRLWCTLNRLRTGHGRCNYMLHKWNPLIDPSCDCGNPAETILHIVTECPSTQFDGGFRAIHNVSEGVAEWISNLKQL